MTLVEAVLAATTLYNMYRTAQATPTPDDDAAILAALDECDPRLAPPGDVDPIALPPLPETGDHLQVVPVGRIAFDEGGQMPPTIDGMEWAPGLPADAIYDRTILTTPTAEQQIWTSPTKGRYIVTISDYGGVKDIRVNPDLLMMAM